MANYKLWGGSATGDKELASIGEKKPLSIKVKTNKRKSEKTLTIKRRKYKQMTNEYTKN